MTSVGAVTGDEAFRGGGRGVVRRDEHGIPQLWAEDADTLAYLQGRVTAHDRAWQLETERRRGEGTLAEAIGPDGVAWDTFARTVNLSGLAQRAFRACAPGTRRWLAAYAAGVRSGLGAGAAAAPEFERTPVGPGRWEPWTPIAVFLVQHILFSTFPHKLWRAHVASAFGAGPVTDSLTGRAWDAVRVLGLDGADPSGAGSNAWAVPGEFTASGLPLLGGDPHRLLEAPGIYQQVRLACPEFDVAGLAFPGVPGVQHFGHTGSVAWAVTNAMADYQDLIVEPLHRRGQEVWCRGEDGAWRPAAVRSERIPVAGAEPVVVEAVETPRGPVVSGGDTGTGTGTGLSLRTPSSVLGDLGFDALPALLRARTAKDVESAFEAWVEPVNSVLVADDTGPHGNVRRFVAGRVPRGSRRAMLLPVPVEDAAWQGWLPLPGGRVETPVVNANDARPADTAELGTWFSPPHRARRIAQLLAQAQRESGTAGLRPEHLPGLSTDTLLGGLETARAAWSSVAESAEPAGPARAVLDRLLGWDGQMDAGSAEAALFARWREAFARRVAADPALAGLHAPHGHPEVFAPWLDVTARIGHAWEPVLRDGDRLGIDVAAAVRGALADVGGDAAGESWSQLHRVLPLRTVPEVPGSPADGSPSTDDGPWDRAAVGVAGDAECVLATSSVPGRTHRVVRGPVARYLWDLAGRARSGWVVPFGATGRPDGHAVDQSPVWAAGRLLPVETPACLPGEEQIAWAGGVLDPPARGEASRRQLGAGHLLTLTVLDPARDIDVLHGWTRAERARFWGLTDADAATVRGLYERVDALVTHHALLLRVDDRPVGLLQTYWPQYDPVSEVYPVRDGDAGIHLLLAPTADFPGAGPDRTAVREALFAALTDVVFEDPRVRRVVVEPDARNARAIARFAAMGFTPGPQVALPTKTARLMFLERPATG